VASELNNLKSLVNSIVEHLMTENDERNHQLACENEMLRAGNETTIQILNVFRDSIDDISNEA
jgi:hypothetical protein